MSSCLRALVVAVLAGVAGACAVRERPVAPPPTQRGLDAESSAELDKLVHDVCGKTVVLLGEEAHHGGGRTVEIKAELVRRLIDRCGFDVVDFESSAYEFVDLNRRLAAGTSAREQVADAIGGLWSLSGAIDPLVDYLYAQAFTRRTRLGGIDAQLGSATSGYEKAGLVSDLVQALDEPRRSSCAEIISRHTNWRYDAEHPADAAAQDALIDCFQEAADGPRQNPVLTVLAHATLTLLTHPSVAGGAWDARERQMAALFRWQQQQSSSSRRTIVWTASVHAARHSEAGAVRPLGEELAAEYGERLASIAFTALGGAYGRGGRVAIAAQPGSLEAQALTDTAKPLRYLSKSALAKLGEVDGLPLSYAKPRRSDWSLPFDGVVVLREEKPLSIERPPAPRFVPQ